MQEILFFPSVIRSTINIWLWIYSIIVPIIILILTVSHRKNILWAVKLFPKSSITTWSSILEIGKYISLLLSQLYKKCSWLFIGVFLTWGWWFVVSSIFFIFHSTKSNIDEKFDKNWNKDVLELFPEVSEKLDIARLLEPEYISLIEYNSGIISLLLLTLIIIAWAFYTLSFWNKTWKAIWSIFLALTFLALIFSMGYREFWLQLKAMI